MAKNKVCGECGAKRGTPHADDCSNKVGRPTKPLSMGGLVISKLPLTKAEADEGLRVSKATGRISLHTPMDRAPPGPCACGSGRLFSECHGAPDDADDFTSGG